ncbi:hypothetical protein VPARA_61690 [Variovorax paradoxus]|uniref:Uncharacterized protein n=1 Tax=Variovorax paradoxus TaxID=34073 RepID=A0A0H2LSK6_VARPD|nr:hypothetical protein VPARA_61690 [Variovorax paradoxus]
MPGVYDLRKKEMLAPNVLYPPGGHPKCPTYGHPNCSTLATVI